MPSQLLVDGYECRSEEGRIIIKWRKRQLDFVLKISFQFNNFSPMRESVDGRKVEDW